MPVMPVYLYRWKVGPSVVGIHSANSLLDTSLLGRGLRYYKHRQEVCLALFFLCLIGGGSLVHYPSAHRAEERSDFLL